jgi:hypothetical protein
VLDFAFEAELEVELEVELDVPPAVDSELAPHVESVTELEVALEELLGSSLALL